MSEGVLEKITKWRMSAKMWTSLVAIGAYMCRVKNVSVPKSGGYALRKEIEGTESGNVRNSR